MILFLFIVSVSFLYAKDPNIILDKVKNKLNKVNDYSVDITIDVNADFVQMPPRKAQVFFKKPEKMRIKSDGFAILPKQGINFSPVKFLNNEYDAIYIKSEKLNSTQVDVIKIIPRSDSSEITLATVWVDEVNNIIRKIEAVTNRGGAFTMQFDYSSFIKWGLPDKMVFSFSIKGMRIPNMAPENIDDKKEMINPKNVDGEVIVKYFNYKINKGIDDKIFNDDVKK